jgi:hypothetical protein
MSYDNCLKIGEDLTIERLISCVMADARVKTVEILEPETIVDINIYSIAVLTVYYFKPLYCLGVINVLEVFSKHEWLCLPHDLSALQQRIMFLETHLNHSS